VSGQERSVQYLKLLETRLRMFRDRQRGWAITEMTCMRGLYQCSRWTYPWSGYCDMIAVCAVVVLVILECVKCFGRRSKNKARRIENEMSEDYKSLLGGRLNRCFGLFAFSPLSHLPIAGPTMPMPWDACRELCVPIYPGMHLQSVTSGLWHPHPDTDPGVTFPT
jgi:hypothetical protein